MKTFWTFFYFSGYNKFKTLLNLGLEVTKKNNNSTDENKSSTSLGVNNNTSNFNLGFNNQTSSIEDKSEIKTRVNVMATIKKLVENKGKVITNPDETARISILNKSSFKDKIKKLWWLGALVIIFLGYQFLSTKNSSEEKTHTSSSDNSTQQTSNSIDYSVKGRGLVYNCSEKSWHCTDKLNFFACKKLSATDKSCFAKGVFKSDEACNKFLETKAKSSPSPSSCL